MLKKPQIPDDVKQEIREMAEDGLRTQSIVQYMGISKGTIRYILGRGHKQQYNKDAKKKYYLKNRKRIQKQQRIYDKQYHIDHKHPCLNCTKLVTKKSKRCNKCATIHRFRSE
jgi:hypothetical protein